MNEKALGEKLQLARKRAGLTQQELCQKAGLSYSTLAKIERGAIRSPSVFTVASIASATGISLQELLGTDANIAQAPALASKKRSKTGVRFVYFDINGVIVRFFHRAFTQLAEDYGGQSDGIETLFWRHNSDVCSGRMSMDEFNTELAKDLNASDVDWRPYYMKNVEQTPGIKELLDWAAEHYEVGLLTDSMPGFVDELRQNGTIPAINYTAVADSSKMGVVKSELKAYEMAQELSGVDGSEILLIDDNRSNLIVADKAGWHVLWFEDLDPENSIARVKQALEF